MAFEAPKRHINIITNSSKQRAIDMAWFFNYQPHSAIKRLGLGEYLSLNYLLT